ncbi:hypothetical protein GH714_001705 [Hevea brasiliensis]|uniref:DUF7032 domain-containing protein n=1 Tax=Hevea brasiliensis TaxID=3981 RepID=A0A6A6LXH3_HEVBR|nr:hypothetical protein GH714_001705 [Hevea brasiliensis]
MLRNKLEELNTSLIAIANCDSTQNPILSGLVSAIILAANNCYDLARSCVDLSYSGKLLMQSDLDVMAAKFDRLLKNLSGICTAGVLTQGFAIVVSKPGLNACKDDMRFYVRDLLTRMKIGDTEMKRQALVNLREVVVEDERYFRVIVEVGDIVHILVNLLDSPEIGIQEEAAKVVSLISGFDSFKPVLVGSGVIGPLVRVLEIGSVLGKEAAARSLQKLTEKSDNAWSVSAHGGVTALLKICASADSNKNSLVQLLGEMASEALTGMVSVPKNRKIFVQDDRNIGFLLQLLDQEEANSSGNKKFLISILISLTSSNNGRRKIVNSGYLKNIEKLAEAEVSDAKRLVRKLSTNRFRSMLNGLWHS